MAKRRLKMRRKRPPSALRAPRAAHVTERAHPTLGRVPPKPYLYVDDLAALVPWTAEAIRTKVRRGEFQRGVHYFQETRRARLIFKWAAIVEVIERTSSPAPVSRPGPRSRAVLDIEQATTALRRLIDQPPATGAIRR